MDKTAEEKRHFKGTCVVDERVGWEWFYPDLTGSGETVREMGGDLVELVRFARCRLVRLRVVDEVVPDGMDELWLQIGDDGLEAINRRPWLAVLEEAWPEAMEADVVKVVIEHSFYDAAWLYISFEG